MGAPVYHLEGMVRARAEAMEDFNGPLDLILYLLSKNKMEIKDIQLSLILDQYLAWMEQRKQLDLEVASEFVAMAAHLVYIKTRMLLSIHDEEALSEMDQLIASLEERQRNEHYHKIKTVIPALEHCYHIGKDYLTKAPELLSARELRRPYYGDPELLRQAIGRVLERSNGRMPPSLSSFSGIVGREPYPVVDKAEEILRQLLKIGTSRFRALFEGNRSRSEIVATFIAVLELCKAERIVLSGGEKDCTVTCTKKSDEALLSDLSAESY